MKYQHCRALNLNKNGVILPPQLQVLHFGYPALEQEHAYLQLQEEKKI